MGIGAKLIKNKMSVTVIKHIEEQCPVEVRKTIYEDYPELEDLRPKGDGKGDSKGEGERDREGKGDGESKGEVELGWSKEMETAKAKDLEVTEEMEVEVMLANAHSPSASHYLDYE